MANFNEEYSVQVADIVTQISGLESQMGIDIIVKAQIGQIINVQEGATIEVEWVDGNGNHKVAQVLNAGIIDDINGLNLGTYYPDGVVFANQAEVDAFFTTPISAKFYKVTII